MGPLMLVLDQPDKATDRRESSEKPGGESGSTRDGQRRREWIRPGLLTKFFNERTRRVLDNNDAGGLLACGEGSRS